MKHYTLTAEQMQQVREALGSCAAWMQEKAPKNWRIAKPGRLTIDALALLDAAMQAPEATAGGDVCGGRCQGASLRKMCKAQAHPQAPGPEGREAVNTIGIHIITTEWRNKSTLPKDGEEVEVKGSDFMGDQQNAALEPCPVPWCPATEPYLEESKDGFLFFCQGCNTRTHRHTTLEAQGGVLDLRGCADLHRHLLRPTEC